MAKIIGPLRNYLLICLLVFVGYLGQAQISADFTSSQTSGCAPFVVNFTDLSSGSATTWAWDFGNGASSNNQNPTAVFSQPGIYTITLTASGPSGSDTKVKSGLIRVNAPALPNFTAVQTQGCSPHTTQFSDLSVPQSGTVNQWFWSFGNGLTSTEQNPTTTFSEIKSYDVYLKVTDNNGCVASITKEDFIRIDGPTADFIYDSVICGLPANVNFINTSTGNNLNYLWNFGDGSTSTAQIPGIHEYTAFDSTQVTLIVTESSTGCSDTTSKNLIVGNYNATFDYNIICDTNAFTIELTNTTETFAQIEWNLNNEAFFFTNNVTYQFEEDTDFEEFLITLKATVDESCTDTTQLRYHLPTPLFTYNAPICSDPFDVTFSNISEGKNLSYYWDFGDTTYSTEINPQHTYDIPPEEFLAKLYVTDEFGCLDSGKRNVVVPFPIARFYTEDLKKTGCVPLEIEFHDTSYTLSSEVVSVHWDFGDPASGANNESNNSDPIHIFNTPGNYNITYTIYTDDGCADTNTFNAYIKAGEKPTSTIIDQSLSSSICYGEKIRFSDLPTYPTVGINSNYWCWTYYHSNASLLTDEEILPVICERETPTNTDSIDLSSIANHRYNVFSRTSDTVGNTYSSGAFDYINGELSTHLITGYNGCYAEFIEPTFVDTAVAMVGYVIEDSLSLLGCSPKSYGFYNASTGYDSIAYAYVYFENESDTLFHIPINGDTIYKNLTISGSYGVRLKVINSQSSCEHEIIDEIIIDSVTVGFDNISNICLENGPVLFDENSTTNTGFLSERKWIFEQNGLIDSIVANNDTAYITFPDTGLYTITLVQSVRNTTKIHGKNTIGFCKYTSTGQIKIEGTKSRAFSDTLFTCKGGSINFTDISKSTTSIVERTLWFGDNSDSSTTLNPSHQYQENGFFRPVLNTLDAFGCTNTFNLSLIEVNSPIVNFETTDTLICKGEVLAFRNRSQGNSLYFNWLIDTLEQLNIDIVHPFDSVGYFDIKLKATDINGCSDSLIKPNHIHVEDFPEAGFMGDMLYIDCPPLGTQFSDTTSPNVVAWHWDFGDGGSAQDENPYHVFTAPGLYSITLIATNYAGCSDTTTTTDYIEVGGPYGTFSFTPDSVCAPDTVAFSVNLENTAYYIWNFADGQIESFPLTGNQDIQKHIYENGGTLTPSIQLIDPTGCFYTPPQEHKIWIDSISAQFETSSNIICDLFDIPFNNTSRSFFTNNYFWDFGNGDTTSTHSPTYSYDTDNTYEVILVQTSPIGCQDTARKTLTVFNAPYPELTLENDNFCVPSLTSYKLTLTNLGFTPDSIYFILNDTVQIPGDSIAYTFQHSGNNEIAFFIEYGSGNCVADSIINQPFYELPIADFSFAPQTVSLESPIVYFTNQSSNASIWSWDFDDFDHSTIQNPGHNYNMQGTYNVVLVASNAGGCSDTTTQEVNVAPYDFVKLPSAFSPNGDGNNDYFGILRAGDLDVISFKVFNRWGNVVFETSDAEATWDGNYKGKPQDAGTYVFYVKGTNKSGEEVEIKGNFTLLR